MKKPDRFTKVKIKKRETWRLDKGQKLRLKNRNKYETIYIVFGSIAADMLLEGQRHNGTDDDTEIIHHYRQSDTKRVAG